MAPSLSSTSQPLVTSTMFKNKQQLPIGARWPRIMRMTLLVRSMTHKQQSTFGSWEEHQHSMQLFPSIARRQRINLHIRLSPGRRPSNDTKNNPLDYLNVQKNAKQQHTFKKLESFALRDDASINPTLLAFRRIAKTSKTTTTIETDRLSFLRARAALLLLPKINEARKLNQSCRWSRTQTKIQFQNQIIFSVDDVAPPSSTIKGHAWKVCLLSMSSD